MTAENGFPMCPAGPIMRASREEKPMPNDVRDLPAGNDLGVEGAAGSLLIPRDRGEEERPGEDGG